MISGICVCAHQIWSPLGRMGRRCGVWPPNVLSQPQYIVEALNRITINFHSDGSVQKPGFEATFTLVDDDSEHPSSLCKIPR